MPDATSPENVVAEVTIQLVDPSSGRPVNSWTFNARDQITIGRSPDQDVEISDPYVSRNHARFDRRDRGWSLTSLGRHGVVVANQLVKELDVKGELLFRLGGEGPLLKFSEASESPFFSSATMSFNSDNFPFVFQLDDSKLQREVEDIAEGEFFQNLKR